jgi:hypothetical protein
MTEQNTTVKGFRKSIAKIGAMSGALAALVHETALSMAEHAKQHGDMTLFVDLYNALHTSQRRKAFTAWLYDFTPIRLRIKDDIALAKGSQILTADSKMFKPWDIDGLRAVTYWDYTKEANPTFLTSDALLKMVERIGKTIQRNIDNGTLGEDVDPAAALEYAERLAKVGHVGLVKAIVPNH